MAWRALKRLVLPSTVAGELVRAIDAIWEWSHQLEPVGHFRTLEYFKDADDGAANAQTVERAIFRVPEKFGSVELHSVHFVPRTTIAGHATDNATFLLSKRPVDGSTFTTMASLTTTASLPDDRATELPLLQRKCDPGETLTFAINKGAAGVVVPAGLLAVVYSMRQELLRVRR